MHPFSTSNLPIGVLGSEMCVTFCFYVVSGYLIHVTKLGWQARLPSDLSPWRYYWFLICVHVYSRFVCMDTCTSCACSVPQKTRRGHRVLRSWSYGWLWAIYVLGMKPRSSGRAADVLNHGAISPVLYCWFLVALQDTEDRKGVERRHQAFMIRTHPFSRSSYGRFLSKGQTKCYLKPISTKFLLQ